MSLRAKVFVAILLTFLVSSGAGLLVRHYGLMPRMEALQAEADQQLVQRVLIGFDVEKFDLQRFSYDYAVWDDTYDHYRDADPDYLSSNYIPNMFLSNELSLVYLLDHRGQAIWSGELDADGESLVPPRVPAAEFWPRLPHPLPGPDQEPISLVSLINTSRGPVLYSATSVKRSDGSGDSPGYLVMARYVDDDLLARVARISQVKFEAEAADPSDQQVLAQQSLETLRRDAHDCLSWVLSDRRSNPILRLTIQAEDYGPLEFWPLPTIVSAVVGFAAWFLMAAFLDRRLVQPVRDIDQHLAAMRRFDNYSRRLSSSRSDELGDLERQCDQLAQHIETQQKLLRSQADQLRELAMSDSLTGLPNRRYFDTLLNDRWAWCQRQDRPLALLMIDVDYFKNYNDALGHDAGDTALKRIAGVLRDAIRRDTDSAARYGGEEFVLLMPGADLAAAEEMANRIHAILAASNLHHPNSKVAPRLTVSIGIGCVRPGHDTSTQKGLFKLADEALYEAKLQGRNRTVTART